MDEMSAFSKRIILIGYLKFPNQLLKSIISQKESVVSKKKEAYGA